MSRAVWEEAPVVEAPRKPAARPVEQAPWMQAPEVALTRVSRAEIPGVDPQWAAGQAPAHIEERRRAQVAQQNPVAEKVLGAIEGALDIVAKVGGGSVGGLLGLASAPFRPGPADRNMAEGAQAGVDLVRKGYGLAGLPAAQGATTQTGAALSEGFDAAMEGLPPVAGVFGTLAAPVVARPALTARQAVRALPQAAGQTVVDALPGPVADAARQTVAGGRQEASAALDRGMEALPERLRPASRRQPVPTAGTMGSGGAAGTDAALQRRERAAALPVPIDLTEGQATRDFAQLRFEGETAKNSAAGEPLRDFGAEQNQRLAQNLDALEELTGAQTASAYDAGSKVVQALAEKAGRAKARIDEAYAAAREAGETADPVPYGSVLAYIDEQTPTTRDKLAPIIRAVEEQLRRNDPEGAGVVSIDALEDVRKMIRANTEPGTPGGFHGGELIRRIDQATEGADGNLYRTARKLRADYARQFEDRAVVADLLDTKKGSADRVTKIERVVERAVQASGVDDLKFLRGVLLAEEGQAGRQAWREIQGRVIASFREHALGTGGPDIRGNPILSPAKLAKRVDALDRDGKLEALFDKRGAQLIRDLVEATQDIKTSPPGAVNMSHSASALKDLWDQFVTLGIAGVPARGVAVLGAIRKDLADRAVKKQVRAALPPKSDARPRTDLGGIFDAEPEPAAPEPRLALPAPTKAKPTNQRLADIERLKEGASPEAVRVLDEQALKIKRENRAAQVQASRDSEAASLEAMAQQTTDPDVRRALQARANQLRSDRPPVGDATELDRVPVAPVERVRGKIPVGQAKELQPSSARAPSAKPLPVAEARELTRDQARQAAPTRRERDLLRLRDEASDPVVIKELDTAISAERRKAAEKARGHEYLRLADAAEDPDLRELFEAKAGEVGVKRPRLPVGEAREVPISPATARAVEAVKLNGQDKAAWNLLYRVGTVDADTAKLMSDAIRIDPAAFDRALQQMDSKPETFAQEVLRIVNGSIKR